MYDIDCRGDYCTVMEKECGIAKSRCGAPHCCIDCDYREEKNGDSDSK